MRSFELLLWTVSAGWASVPLIHRPSLRVDTGFAVAALVAASLHLSVEGVRFHLVPTYVLLAVLLALSIRRARLTGEPRWLPRWARFAVAIPVVMFLAVSGALPSVFPVFTYEKPSGPYAIGTREYVVPGASNSRDLVIQTWYPAAAGITGASVGITSRPALLATAYASFTGLPGPLFDNLRLVRTHAISGAPLASDRQRFPIVLFSHGPLSANRSQSVFLMEALASNGFIAVAIDHTGYASTTIFPDGHAVPPSPEATWPAVVDAKSTAMLKTWVDDVRVVIDRLERLDVQDPSSVLTGRLDLSRIGYVGASFGGSVVVQALLQEPRLRAGVAQDGKPYFSDETLTHLERPLMYMQSQTPYIKSSEAQLAKWGLTSATFRMAEQDHYARLMQLFARANGPIYNLYIRRTNHVTFSDLYRTIVLPDSQLMDIRRAHRIINDYTLAFFERYLNGTSTSLVDQRTPAPYEEVTLAARNIDDDNQ